MWKSNQNILLQKKKKITKCFVHLQCQVSFWCFVSIFISKEVLTVWKAKFPNIALSFEAQIAINYLVPGLIPAHTSTCPRQVGECFQPLQGRSWWPSHLWRCSQFPTITFYCTWWRGEKDSLTVDRVACFLFFFFQLVVLYSQLGKSFFSPQPYWLEPRLQVKNFGLQSSVTVSV